MRRGEILSQNLDMTIKKGYNRLVYNAQENIRVNRYYYIIKNIK